MRIALFLAGFATFVPPCRVQPPLPVLVRGFGVGAAAASLGTGLPALSIPATTTLARRRVPGT